MTARRGAGRIVFDNLDTARAHVVRLYDEEQWPLRKVAASCGIGYATARNIIIDVLGEGALRKRGGGSPAATAAAVASSAARGRARRAAWVKQYGPAYLAGDTRTNLARRTGHTRAFVTRALREAGLIPDPTNYPPLDDHQR